MHSGYGATVVALYLWEVAGGSLVPTHLKVWGIVICSQVQAARQSNNITAPQHTCKLQDDALKSVTVPPYYQQ